MEIGQKTAVFLATGFFVGRSPWAPGTVGTLLAVPLSFLLSRIPWAGAYLCVAAFAAVAIHTAGVTEKVLGQEDPGCIVIDEMAGMLVTLAGLPFTWKTLAAGFFLFRLLDILKPPPIRWIERSLRGGWAVVGDDLAAGICVQLVLRICVDYL